jgi:dTDP-glucose 4,6-dehydratase
MKKVLLTGAAGFVGSNILPILLEKYTVVATDDFSKGGKIENIKDFFNHKNFIFSEQDLTQDFSNSLLKEIKECETIFNVASYASVEESIHYPKKVIMNNMEIMFNLLQHCMDKKIIHLSSDEVYGESLHYSHAENFNYNPSNPYAASKAMQENLLFSYWRTYGLKLIICNTINLIGINQTEDKFLPLIIKKIMAEEQIDIYSVNNRIGARIYMDVKNLGDAFIFIDDHIEPKIFKYTNKKERPIKLNVVNEQEKKITNIDMVRFVSNIIDRDFSYNVIKTNKKRPGYDRFYKINGKTLKQYGWQPKYYLKDELKNIVDFYKEKHGEYSI